MNLKKSGAFASSLLDPDKNPKLRTVGKQKGNKEQENKIDFYENIRCFRKLTWLARK